jgi:hypothetical protein
MTLNSRRGVDSYWSSSLTYLDKRGSVTEKLAEAATSRFKSLSSLKLPPSRGDWPMPWRVDHFFGDKTGAKSHSWMV